MWAIRNVTENRELLLIFLQLVLSAVALYYYVQYKRTERKAESVQRLVEMGFHFYDEDKRFLSIKDEEFKYYLLNEAFVSELGKRKEDLLGKTDKEVFDEEMAMMLHQVDRKIIETGEKFDKALDYNGRTYRMHKFPLMLPNGKKGIGAYAEDITDAQNRRKDRERIIRRNEILLDVAAKEFSSSHEQLDYVLNKALALTESTYGYIYLYHEEEQIFILENFSKGGVITPSRNAAQQMYRLDRMGLWSESVRTRKPMIYNGVNETGDEAQTDNSISFNMMTVPVIILDQILAVIGVANNPKGYQTEEADELSILMTGVWNAKERRESTLELLKANQELAANKERLTLILNSSAEGIYGMDIHGDFTFINKSALMLLGYEDSSEVMGRNCHDLIHHSTKEGLSIARENCKVYESMREGDIVTGEDEVFNRKDGSSFDARYSAHPKILNGKIIGSVVTFSDITERKKHEEEVLYLSYHDTLTGLYNRTYLEHISADLEQEKYLPLSVVVGDVNGLKLSNDIFGHKKGDEFLKKIAQIIRENTREEDILFRVGGDEFYLFMKNTSEETSRTIMGRISGSICEEDFHGVRGGISLGLSVMKSLEVSLDHVMSDAEQEMYREKTLTKSNDSKRQLKSFVDIMMRSEEERVHAENSVKTVEEIGRALSLSAEEMNKLKDAAYVHDIGKITQIMSEKENEYGLSTRKDHAVIGYRILNSFEKTMDIARIVLSHHEKWDGSGYPNGLKGEELPLLSRIITVAERYDRLTSGYSASPATKEDIFSVMKMESGTVLDGSLVDLLIEIKMKKVSGT